MKHEYATKALESTLEGLYAEVEASQKRELQLADELATQKAYNEYLHKAVEGLRNSIALLKNEG